MNRLREAATLRQLQHLLLELLAASTQPCPATTRQSNTENCQSASAPSVRPIHPD